MGPAGDWAVLCSEPCHTKPGCTASRAGCRTGLCTGQGCVPGRAPYRAGPNCSLLCHMLCRAQLRVSPCPVQPAVPGCTAGPCHAAPAEPALPRRRSGSRRPRRWAVFCLPTHGPCRLWGAAHSVAGPPRLGQPLILTGVCDSCCQPLPAVVWGVCTPQCWGGFLTETLHQQGSRGLGLGFPIPLLTPSLAGEEEAELGDGSPVHSREFASGPGQGQEPC